MNLSCRWEMLLMISLWSQVNFVPGTYCEEAAVSHLSREDVLLLKDEQDPKCFTRTGLDFTCFFEAADNRTYDLLYKFSSLWTGIRCDASVQEPGDDTFLHICSFPAADVLLFVETHVDVVEHNSSSSIFTRTVSVEDHFLLDPPLNVSLHQTGRAGQLLVSWRTKVPTYCGDVMYRVRYFNQGVGEKTEEVKQDEHYRFILASLVPGEQAEVQVSVKCSSSPSEGHWSRWSQPVRGIVPQSADDVSLVCFTSALQNVTCQWNRSRYGLENYKLFYKNDLSDEWSECPTDEFTDMCRFHGDGSRKVRIRLSSAAAPLGRTFYTGDFTLNNTILLDPPLNVSLHQTGRAGQLLVSSRAKVPTYCGDVMYRVRYFNQGVGEKTEEVKQDEHYRFILDSLVPGEQTEVQVSVKCSSSPSEGHWSRWSQPVRGFVPQSADDVSLVCFTSDLQNVTCQWNRSRYGLENYKLFYKIDLSDEWSECPTDEFTDMCRFHGDESRKVRVRLSSAAAPLGRTFYTGDFTLNNTIKTSAPSHLRGAVETNQLCLKWEAPLPSVSAHLQYEVAYRTRPGGAWKRVSLEGPEPGTCLEVSAGSQYHVKVRAKPDGSQYSGLWSDWSHELTGRTPTEPGLWLMLCIPVSMLITVTFLISTYLSKLKQLFWPPLPNLDKVLHNFLTDIDKQRWDPPLTLKQWSEETTESVLEIISEDVRKPSEESTQLLPPEETPSSREQVDGIPGAEVFPDYVTLNKECVILCPNGNKYMYEKVGEERGPGPEVELLQTCGCSVPLSSASDFLNFSYEPLAEAADRPDCRVPPVREPGNIYTNLPCS